MGSAIAILFKVFAPFSLIGIIYALVWFLAPRGIRCVFRREVGGFFSGPLAYVFILIFVFLSMAFAFVIGNFIEIGEASLWPFFQWHPWLFMILAPAVGMRLWSEEHRMGTTELLLTMPVPTWQAIAGKFLAASMVLYIALVATFPIVITVGYLGDPDIGVIVSSYFASYGVACVTLAVTLVASAFTRSQVVCLIVSVCVCLILILAGFGPIVTFLRDATFPWFSEFIQKYSLLYHSGDPIKGVFRFHNVVYFVSIVVFCLFTTSIVIRSRRS